MRYYSLLILIFFTNCTQGSYHFGIYTTSIFGTITNLNQEKATFIVVVKNQYSLIEHQNSYLTMPLVEVIMPNAQGHFNIDYDANTKSQTIYFITKNHQLYRINSVRSLGIGKEELSVQLELSVQWSNDYYFKIKPMISYYLADDRYFKDKNAFIFLNKWLLEVEKELNLKS